MHFLKHCSKSRLPPPPFLFSFSYVAFFQLKIKSEKWGYQTVLNFLGWVPYWRLGEHISWPLILSGSELNAVTECTCTMKQLFQNNFWPIESLYTKFVTKLFTMDFTPSPWTINNNFPKLGSCEQYPRVKFFSSIKGKNLTFGHVTVKWRCLISNYLKKQILLQSTRFLWKNVWRSSIPRGENYMTRVECLKT